VVRIRELVDLRPLREFCLVSLLRTCTVSPAGSPTLALRSSARVRDDASLRRMLQKPVSLMARQYRQDRLLSQRINSFIAASAGLPPDAEVIAGHLNVSLRSLQRHLQDEGTSLLSLKSKARRLRAEELLRRGDLPLKRVARLAGYGDVSSFGRAFRRWTGQSPAEFRRNASSPARVPPSDRVEGPRRDRSASG